MSTALFETIPQNNYFADDNNKIDCEKVINVLEFKKKDVAVLVNIKPEEIKFNDDIPLSLKERIQEWAILFNHVADFFKGDIEKTVLWFKTPNYLLGNISPRDMIRFGRFDKLHRFIINALSENKPY